MATPQGCQVICSNEGAIIEQDMSVCDKTARYVDEDNPAKTVRRIWSVNSKCGGSYVSIKTAAPSRLRRLFRWFLLTVSQSWNLFISANGNGATRTVSATGEADSTKAVTKINLVRENPLQPWHYLKFPNPQQNGPEFTVSASEDGVTASDQTNDATTFQVITLSSPNDLYAVIESNKSNEKEEKLYLSSDGAGNMKLKVWNAPIPGPPGTTEQVDPALLFRMVRPYGQDF